MRAISALFLRHGAQSTPEGRSLRLLRAWLSPARGAHFAEKGYFEVIGGDTGKLDLVDRQTEIGSNCPEVGGRFGAGLLASRVGIGRCGGLLAHAPAHLARKHYSGKKQRDARATHPSLPETRALDCGT